MEEGLRIPQLGRHLGLLGTLEMLGTEEWSCKIIAEKRLGSSHNIDQGHIGNQAQSMDL